MNLISHRVARFFYACFFVTVLAACGGGGGGNATDDSDNDPGTNNPAPTEFDCEGSGVVGITGKTTYDRVPTSAGLTGARLDYSRTHASAIRQAEVQAICPDGSQVYATTFTDDAGRYQLEVPADVDVELRVRSNMQKSGSPSWNLRVVDNTRDQAIWALAGEVFESGTDALEVNLHAGSGWGGNSYDGERAAGPFAIMDSMYVAMQRVLEAEPDANFPALTVNWSPMNTLYCSGGSFPYSDGCIGTSFFADYGGSAGRNIFILGTDGEDTDEYDDHVVIHEWGHYYEDAFARSDSIGGQHGAGDSLDMRVAFGEGWGNAWSGIATDDPVYIDTSGSDQAQGFSFDVEGEPGHIEGNAGWWNEGTIQHVLYDLYDGLNDDGIELGFAPLHAVLTGGQKTTEAATSIFPFVHYLKQNESTQAASIDDLLLDHNVSEIFNEWGDGRGNDTADRSPPVMDPALTDYVSPIYDDISTEVAAGTTFEVCGTNAFRDGDNEYNRIGARQFMTYEVPVSGNWLVRLDGVSHPEGLKANGDPDFFIALRGTPITADFQQNVANSGVDDSAGDGDGAGAGIETATVSLNAGETYVIETVEYLNVDNDSATGGDVCHDLTFELE